MRPPRVESILPLLLAGRPNENQVPEAKRVEAGADDIPLAESLPASVPDEGCGPAQASMRTVPQPPEGVAPEAAKTAKGERLSNGLTNGKGLVNGRGLTNELTNDNGQVNGRGSTKGLTNGKGRVNGRGLTNGLTNGKGIVTGRGLDNGLTNGVGFSNGRGLTNGGLTNGGGAVNGRKKGLVNGSGHVNGIGLVNGNGFINGRGLVNGKGLINGEGLTNGRRQIKDLRSRQRPKARRNIAMVAAVLIVALIIAIPIYFSTQPRSGISIDGQFGDWNGVANKYSADEASSVPSDPNVDIAGFGASAGATDLALYVKVAGKMMAGSGQDGLDTLVIFIDSGHDGNGYSINSPGGILSADLKLEVRGHGGKIDSTSYSKWDGTNPDDYGGWSQIGTPEAKVAGSELESSVWYSGTGLARGSEASILFYMRDAGGSEDYSDYTIGQSPGVLSVRQGEMVPGPGGGSLTLEASAHGRNMNITSLTVQRLGSGSGGRVSLIGGGLDLNASFGTQLTFSGFVLPVTKGSRVILTLNATGVCGTFGMGIPSGRSMTASTQGRAAHISVSQAPNTLVNAGGSQAGNIIIDGAFGDWEQTRNLTGYSSRLDGDNDVGNASAAGSPGLAGRGTLASYADDNINLQESAEYDPGQNTLYYYARVWGQALGGQIVPAVKRALPVPSGTGGGGKPPENVTGNAGSDVLYVLVDSDGNTTTGFPVLDAAGKTIIGAEHCALVTGKNGRVLSTKAYSYNGGWHEEAFNVLAAAGGRELELSISGLATGPGHRAMIIAEDWTGNADRSDGTLGGSNSGRDYRELTVTETDVSHHVVVAGSDHNQMFKIDMDAAGGPVDVTGIEILRSGNAPDRDIAAVRLSLDSNGDGRYERSDQEISAPVKFSGGRAAITGLPVTTVRPGIRMTLFVTIDVSASSGLSATFGAKVSSVEAGKATVRLVNSDATSDVVISGDMGRDSVTTSPVINEVYNYGGSFIYVEIYNPTPDDLSNYYITVTTTSESSNLPINYLASGGINYYYDTDGWSSITDISLFDSEGGQWDDFTNLSDLTNYYSRARYRDSSDNPTTIWYTESSPSLGSKNRLFPSGVINEVEKDSGDLNWVEVYNPSSSEVYDYALIATDSDGEHEVDVTDLSTASYWVPDDPSSWYLTWPYISDISLKDTDGNIIDTFTNFTDISDGYSRARYRNSTDDPTAVWYTETSPTQSTKNVLFPGGVINEVAKFNGQLTWVEVYNSKDSEVNDYKLVVNDSNGEHSVDVSSLFPGDYCQTSAFYLDWSGIHDISLKDADGNIIDAFTNFTDLIDGYSRARYLSANNSPTDTWYTEPSPTPGSANRAYSPPVINEVDKESGNINWVEVYNPSGNDISNWHLTVFVNDSSGTYTTESYITISAFSYDLVWLSVPWLDGDNISLYDDGGNLADRFSNFSDLPDGHSRARFIDYKGVPQNYWYEEKNPTEGYQNHPMPTMVINEYAKNDGNLTWVEIYNTPAGTPPGLHLTIYNDSDWSIIGNYNISASNDTFLLVENINLTWTTYDYMYLYDENLTNIDSFGDTYGFPDIANGYSVARYADSDSFPDVYNYYNLYHDSSPTKGTVNLHFPKVVINELEKNSGNISWIEFFNPSWGDRAECSLIIYNKSYDLQSQYNFSIASGSYHVVDNIGLDWNSTWFIYLYDNGGNWIDSFGNTSYYWSDLNISNGSSYAKYRQRDPTSYEWRWYIESSPTNGSANNMVFPTLYLNELGKENGSLSWAEIFNPDASVATRCTLKSYNSTNVVIGEYNFSLSNGTITTVENIGFNWTSIYMIYLTDNNNNQISSSIFTPTARNLTNNWSYAQWLSQGGDPTSLWYLEPTPTKGAQNLKLPRMYIDEAGKENGNLSWVEVFNPYNDTIPGCNVKVQYYSNTLYEYVILGEASHGGTNQTYFVIENISINWSEFNISSMTYITLTDNNDNVLYDMYITNSVISLPDNWSYASYLGTDGLPTYQAYRDPNPTKGSANYLYPTRIYVNEAGKENGNLSWVEIYNPYNYSLPGGKIKIAYYDYTTYAWISLAEASFGAANQTYFEVENLTLNWSLFNRSYAMILLTDTNDNQLDYLSVIQSAATMDDNWSYARYLGSDGVPGYYSYRDPNPTKGSANHKFPSLYINEAGKENGNLTWVEIYNAGGGAVPGCNLRFYNTSGFVDFQYNFTIASGTYIVLDSNITYNWSNLYYLSLYDNNENYFDYLYINSPSLPDNSSIAKYVGPGGNPASQRYNEPTPTKGSANTRKLPRIFINEIAKGNGNITWIELFNAGGDVLPNCRLSVYSNNYVNYNINISAGSYTTIDIGQNWSGTYYLYLTDDSGNQLQYLYYYPDYLPNIADNDSYARFIDSAGNATDTWYDEWYPTNGSANHLLPKVVINEYAKSYGNLSWVELANPLPADASGWHLLVNYTNASTPAQQAYSVSVPANGYSTVTNIGLNWTNVTSISLVAANGTVVDQVNVTSLSDGHSWARYRDRSGFPTDVWYDESNATQGTANRFLLQVVINEIAKASGNLSWVELFNPSSADVSGWHLRVYYNSSGNHTFSEYNVSIPSHSYAVVDNISLNWSSIEDLRLLDGSGNLVDSYWSADLANLTDGHSFARYLDHSGNPMNLWYDATNMTKGSANLTIPEFSGLVLPMLGLIFLFAVARRSGAGRTRKPKRQ